MLPIHREGGCIQGTHRLWTIQPHRQATPAQREGYTHIYCEVSYFPTTTGVLTHSY